MIPEVFTPGLEALALHVALGLIGDCFGEEAEDQESGEAAESCLEPEDDSPVAKLNDDALRLVLGLVAIRLDGLDDLLQGMGPGQGLSDYRIGSIPALLPDYGARRYRQWRSCQPPGKGSHGKP